MRKFNYRYLFIPLVLFLLTMLYLLLLHRNDSGVSNLPAEQKSFMYSGCYSEAGGNIYYNKPFRGYFQVKGADAATFIPLNMVGDNGTEAKDKDHIYFKAEIISGLKPAETVYLGENFCKSGNQIFYGNHLIKDADAASFRFICGYYAADNTHLYYKDNSIPGADVATLTLIKYDAVHDPKPDNYLFDKNHVYYKGSIINDASPALFTTLHVEDDQWNTQYAFDGTHYFYRQYEILINGSEKDTHLSLLTLDKGFAWFGIFYQGKSIFCYNTQSLKLMPLASRSTETPFTTIDRGIFTDGKYVYYTYRKDAGGGKYVGISVVMGASPSDFRSVSKFEGKSSMEGTIYQSGSRRYFHTTYAGSNAAGLRLFEADGTINDLPQDEASKKYFEDEDAKEVSWKGFAKMFKKDIDYNDN